MPARSSVSTVGNSSGLVPCHSATTGTRELAQVGEQLRLHPHVAEQHDGVGVPGLQHRGQRDRLVETPVHVAEHDVVAVRHRLDDQRLDRAGEERVAEVAHHGADQVGRGARAARAPAGWAGSPAARRPAITRSRVSGAIGTRGRRAAEHTGHGALRHLGRGGDVAHGRHGTLDRRWRGPPGCALRRRPGLTSRRRHPGQASTNTYALRAIGVPPGCADRARSAGSGLPATAVPVALVAAPTDRVTVRYSRKGYRWLGCSRSRVRPSW